MTEVRHFFIAGMPRSRTAWMANLMTTEESFCWHDGIKHCASWEDLRRVLDVPNRKFTGDSDTGIALFWRRLVKDYPRARLVLLWRDEADSLADFNRHFGFEGDYSMAFMQAAAEWNELRKQRPDALVMDWTALVEESACRAVFEHCTHGEMPWDSTRWRMLDALEINVRKDCALKMVNSELGKETLCPS